MIGDGHGLPADIWMASELVLRGRCQWLHGFVDCSGTLERLDSVLNTQTAASVFATGVQRVRDHASLEI